MKDNNKKNIKKINIINKSKQNFNKSKKFIKKSLYNSIKKSKIKEIKNYATLNDPEYKIKAIGLPDEWYIDMTLTDFNKYENNDLGFMDNQFDKIKNNIENKYITLDRILNIKYISLDDKTKLIEKLCILKSCEKDPYDFIKYRDLLLLDINKFENITEDSYKQKKLLDKKRKELDNMVITTDDLENKILNLDLDKYYKTICWNKYKKLSKMSQYDSEYYKLKEWLDTVVKIPFNKINNSLIHNNQLLVDIKNKLDKELYGMKSVKEQLLMIINHKLNNPNSSNISLALVGPPGVGKTHLIQILSEVLQIPFQHISAGTINDSTFLTGHSYTYEGSKPGKIVESLIKMKCKNGIFFFDEIDKLSQTTRGHEITNQLIHISDFTQNHLFTDKYLPEIPIDLSKSWFLFSLNRIEDMNPFLRNRMNFIYVNGYNNNDKLTILKNYLIPRLFNDFNLTDKFIFGYEILHYIIKNTEKEDGIRELKRSILTIFKCLELIFHIKKDNDIEIDISFIRNKIKYNFPYNIEKDDVDLFLKKDIPDNFPHFMYI